MKAMIDMTILSPQGTIYDGRVSHATFPGEAGAFAVYPSHAPIISMLAGGNIVCFSEDGGERSFAIRNGFVEVKNNRATACVEAATAAGSL
ncbi:MAG: F0F1 ATP synthase subunit epsilon [Tannerella sp.]|jgi:F-type H+-transporting ATPase subunit epsilon|nr:F0F1 ATP synthase subunit epsilon [Tannerella sp.]